MKWFRFYHDALDDPKVQRMPGELYKFWVNMLCLASRSDERGLIEMSIEDIAFDVRLDDETAKSLMENLIRRDLIDETCEGFQIHNWNARQFKSDNVSERVTKHRERQKVADETLQETLPETGNETLKPSVNTDQQINRVNMRSGERDKTKSSEPEKFVEFYAAYPRKKARADACKAWKSLNPSNELAEMILSAIKKQSETTYKGKDQQYIPYPASWLRAGQWDDEIETPAPLRRIDGGKYGQPQPAGPWIGSEGVERMKREHEERQRQEQEAQRASS